MFTSNKVTRTAKKSAKKSNRNNIKDTGYRSEREKKHDRSIRVIARDISIHSVEA